MQTDRRTPNHNLPMEVMSRSEVGGEPMRTESFDH